MDTGLEEEESTVDDIIPNQGSKEGETLYNEEFMGKGYPLSTSLNIRYSMNNKGGWGRQEDKDADTKTYMTTQGLHKIERLLIAVFSNIVHQNDCYHL